MYVLYTFSLPRALDYRLDPKTAKKLNAKSTMKSSTYSDTQQSTDVYTVSVFETLSQFLCTSRV